MAILDSATKLASTAGISELIGSALTPQYAITFNQIDTKNKDPMSGVNYGNTVFTPSSWISVEPIGESQITTAQLEKNSYSSFNKVTRPAELRVSFVIEGSLGYSGSVRDSYSDTTESRSSMIEKLEKMRKYAYTYDIETPDTVYENFDLVRYDYSIRSNKGVTLLTINAYFQEIRNIAEVSISSSLSNSSGTQTQNASTGTVTLGDINKISASTFKNANASLDSVTSLQSSIQDAAKTVSEKWSELSTSTPGRMLQQSVHIIQRYLL